MSNSPAAYLEDGRLVIRASSLDRCQRCLVGLALGFTPMTPPEKAVAVFQRGHRVEDEVVAHLNDQPWADQPWKVYSRQQSVELAVGDRAVIRGHLDGITVADGDEQSVLEIKSCAPSSWNAWMMGRWEAWDKWEWQTSIYSHATGLSVDLVAAEVVDGEWTGTYDLFRITEPRIPLSRIHARVLDIQRYVDEGKLPPTCSSNDWPCSLHYLCSKPESPPDEDPALDTLAVLLDRARTEKKRHEAMEKEIRGRIDELLGERDKVRTDAWSVTRVDQARTTLDKDKLQEAFGDLSAYEKVTIHPQLRVTKRKDGGRGGFEASGGSVGKADSGAHISPRDSGEREDGSGDGDRRPVTADPGDEDLLHPRDGSQPGHRPVPGDDTLPSEERRA